MVNLRAESKEYEVVEKITKIKDADGNPINEITVMNTKLFKFKKGGVSFDNVKPKLVKLLKSKHFKGRRNTKLYLVSVRYANGWYSGDWFSYPDVNVFDINDYYPNVDHGFDTTIYEIRIYEKNKPPQAGGSDIHNDCLYDCLNRCHFRLPFNHPAELKKFLNIGRDEPVDIKHICKLQNKIKCNIQISGDYIYQSPYKYNEEVFLQLQKGHYTIKSNENSELINRVSFVERTVVIYDYDEAVYWIYDGKTKRNVEASFIQDNFKKPKSAKYLLIKKEPDMNEKEQYDDYIKMAVELKEASHGKINLFKNDIKGEAKRIFQSFIRIIKVAPLEQVEAQWVSKAFKGGFMYCKPDYYEGVHSYDFVSMYPSCMKSGSFPIDGGEYHTLTEKPTTFYPFGIYRAEIECNHPLFKYNPNKHYTHYDLNGVEVLGGQIKLIIDGQPNALLYSNRRNNLFTKYVNMLFEYKQKGFKGAKLMLNILYGLLSRKTSRILHTTISEINIYPNEVIKHIEPLNEGHTVKLIKRDKPFMENLARVAPFITANARLHMIQLLHKQMDIVVRIQTDGFITTSPFTIPEKLSGDGIGMLKEEDKGSRVALFGVNDLVYL